MGCANFISKVQNLIEMNISGDFLISFRFCAEMVNVKISGVLILLLVTVRLEMEYSEVLISFQDEEVVKITSSKSTIISPFHSSFY